MTAAPLGVLPRQIRAFPRGKILWAPLGSTVPVNTSDPWDAAWLHTGIISRDAAVFDPGDSWDGVDAWQMPTPARWVLKGADMTISFTMRQTNWLTLARYGNGGATSAGSLTGDWKYSWTPATISTPDEGMLGIEAVEGSAVYRGFTNRGQITKRDKLPFAPSKPAEYAVTYSVSGIDDTTDLFTLLAHDANLASA